MRKLLISSALILSAGMAAAQAPQAEDGPGPNMVIEVAGADGTAKGRGLGKGRRRGQDECGDQDLTHRQPP